MLLHFTFTVLLLCLAANVNGSYNKAAETAILHQRAVELEDKVWPTKNWAEITKFYAEDAVFSIEGKLAKGREEIRKVFSERDLFNQWALSPPVSINEFEVHQHIATVYA